jgi:hypothetical protein
MLGRLAVEQDHWCSIFAECNQEGGIAASKERRAKALGPLLRLFFLLFHWPGSSQASN